MREYIGQQFIIGLSGTELTKEEAQFITDNNIGGVILFARNFSNVEQLHKLVTDIQRLRYQLPNQTPLFISVDMEGGRVQRFKDPFTIWPPVAHLGEIDSSTMCFQFSQAMGEELKSVGINLNFAPCVDILVNPENEVIGDRAFSSDAQQVAKLSSALVRGYIKADVVPCAKHFPGHGYTKIDSHHDLPVDERTLKDLETQGDLEPFKKVIKSRVDMIMTAHIQYPNIDKNFPVTLSSLFLQNVLRGALRFKGIIITDDLDMKALTKNYVIEEIPIMALNAGANMLLYCNEPASPQKAVKSIAKALSEGKLDKEILQKNHKLILDTKKKKFKQPIEPFSLDKAQQIIGRAEHKKLAQDILEKNVEEYLNKTT